MFAELNRFSSSFITKTFFADYKNLSYINCGRCYDWAYYAYCLFPDVTLWTSDCHAWIEYDGRFYDSECELGVKDWSALPCNGRCGYDEVEPQEMDVESFKELWDKNGAGRRHHWNTMIKEIRDKGLTPIRN